jgi:hypothetical protein
MEKNVTEVFEPSAPRDDIAIGELRDGGLAKKIPVRLVVSYFPLEGSWKGK